MNLETFAKMRGYQSAYEMENQRLTDHFLNSPSGDQLRAEVLTKRLQFDCTKDFYEEVEQLCSFLDCSKREFLQMAVRNALDKAHDIFMDSFKEVRGVDFFEANAPQGDK
jgi:hypothetical protein